MDGPENINIPKPPTPSNESGNPPPIPDAPGPPTTSSGPNLAENQPPTPREPKTETDLPLDTVIQADGGNVVAVLKAPVPTSPQDLSSSNKKSNQQVSPVEEIQNMRVSEEQRIEYMKALDQTDEGKIVLGKYREALVRAEEAVNHVVQALKEIEGAHLIHDVALDNTKKQANYLLAAAAEIQTRGRSTASLFGRYHTFSDLSEIATFLDKINADFGKVTKLPQSFDAFGKEGLPVIDKYLFDSRELERSNGAVKTLVFEDPADPGLTDHLIEDNVLPQGQVSDYL